jgi:apoptosis-inducing factor 3
MSSDSVQPEGPDLRRGVELSSIADGAMLSGHIGDEPAVLVRRGEALFAVGAKCTHCGGPLS